VGLSSQFPGWVEARNRETSCKEEGRGREANEAGVEGQPDQGLGSEAGIAVKQSTRDSLHAGRGQGRSTCSEGSLCNTMAACRGR
jgi:hypothetical protein